ncbi:lipopolysaccharide-induced tumor necrosis factor-alpha factor homolog [Bactrocera tryoni]|uniref:lipopolysaccharide-induced tumor necrosis factor-alpha factor homolog n=1 Tax=Bactrocera tryoni TaxID=59916 RepID=UPI001A96B9DE|nr:lipopolysaccharide-induced tumor necrosis factor-alpha factor homolog [Bactrocera tryoni]
MSHHTGPMVQVTTPHSTPMTCPSCGATICTTVEYRPSVKTHIIGLLLCLMCCWPCVCVPYCMKSCQSANHYCPNCDVYIGSYRN